MKRLALLIAAVASLPLIPLILAGHAEAASVKAVGQLQVPSLNLTRVVYDPPLGDAQSQIDACVGAIRLRSIPGVTWLAAHRTSCGATGFGGIETLTNGSIAVVAVDGQSAGYVMTGEAIGTVNTTLTPPPSTALVLQTSRDATTVYLKYFSRIDQAKPATGRGKMLAHGDSTCVDSGGSEGEFALVNLTPVGSAGGGFGTLYPAGGSPGNTSAVNWSGPDPSPNTTLTRIGVNGRICVGVQGAATDMVADVVAIAPANTFNWRAQRLLDTRLSGPPVFNSKVCFNVPGVPGDWAVLNVTPIGLTQGFGVVETANRELSISNVNYTVGLPNPNLAFVQIDLTGQVCYRSVGAADVVIDLEATAPQATFWGSPTRQLDTRLDGRLATDRQCNSFAFSTKTTWALINLTPDPTRGAGLGRLHTSHEYAGTTSDVNYVDLPDPNLTAVMVNPWDQLCITSQGAPSEWIIDVMAFAPADRFREPTRRRVLDTRLSS